MTFYLWLNYLNIFCCCWIYPYFKCLIFSIFPLQYLFTDTTNSYLWNTFDVCQTVQGFSIPFKPIDLLLHSKRSNLVLGYDSSHPNKQVWTLMPSISTGLFVYRVFSFSKMSGTDIRPLVVCRDLPFWILH